MGEIKLGKFIAFLIVFLGSIHEAVSTDDFYYMKACYPWFRPPELRHNCSLRCSLTMPYMGVSLEEVAICLSDGMTGITCQSNSDCQLLLEGSYCKRASCMCEEKGLDRFYVLSAAPDTSINFCTAPSDIHSIHLPLVLFPWKTLMIVFGMLVFTGLLLMALKWLSPIISVFREFHRTERHPRTIEHLNSEPRPHVQDKPPSYEVAVRLEDVLPSYEDAQRLSTATQNSSIQPAPTGDVSNLESQSPVENSASTSNPREPLLPSTVGNASIVATNSSSVSVQLQPQAS